jgi:hypothetical protein
MPALICPSSAVVHHADERGFQGSICNRRAPSIQKGRATDPVALPVPPEMRLCQDTAPVSSRWSVSIMRCADSSISITSRSMRETK